jgi:hypothetical protein
MWRGEERVEVVTLDSVRAELVEALPFFLVGQKKKGQGFDRLSPNG